MSKVYLTQDSENTLRDLAKLFKPAGANENRILRAILSHFTTSNVIPLWSRQMPVGTIKHEISEDLFARCIVSAVRKESGDLSYYEVINSIIIHAGTLAGRKGFRDSVRASLKLELEARNQPPCLILDLPVSVLRKKQRKMDSERLGLEVTKLLNRSIKDLAPGRVKRILLLANGVPRGTKPHSHRIVRVRKLEKKVFKMILKLRPLDDSVINLINHFNHAQE